MGRQVVPINTACHAWGARRRRRFTTLLAAALIGSAAGCADEPLPRLADFLIDPEFDAPIDSAVYVSLGEFDVPVAASTEEAGSPIRGKPVWLRLRFELSAETSPDFESSLVAALARNRGALNDAVMTIIRTSELDELNDPRLAAIKSRLGDAAHALFGNKVRQLVVNEPLPEPMPAPPIIKASHHAKHSPGGESGGDLADAPDEEIDDHLAEAPTDEGRHHASH